VEHEKLFRRLLWKGGVTSQSGYEVLSSNERIEVLPRFDSNVPA
jgi:hypothetical protein